MKVQIVKAERWVSIETKYIEVDLQEFMREHFPRKHNWEDEGQALAYLQSQMHGKYMEDWANQNCERPGREKSWAESAEYWLNAVND